MVAKRKKMPSEKKKPVGILLTLLLLRSLSSGTTHMTKPRINPRHYWWLWWIPGNFNGSVTTDVPELWASAWHPLVTSWCRAARGRQPAWFVAAWIRRRDAAECLRSLLWRRWGMARRVTRVTNVRVFVNILFAGLAGMRPFIRSIKGHGNWKNKAYLLPFFPLNSLSYLSLPFLFCLPSPLYLPSLHASLPSSQPASLPLYRRLSLLVCLKNIKFHFESLNPFI